METLKKSLIILLLFLAGCKVTGVYQHIAYNTNIKLTINKDKSFKECIKINALVDTFYGQWNKDKDTINLIISKPVIPNYIDERTKVIEYFDADLDSILIKVYVEDSLSIAQIYLNRDKQNGILTDDRGKLYLFNTNLNSFAVSSLGYPVFEYEINNQESNLFEAYIYDWTEEPIWTRYDVTYQWVLKNRKLYPINNKTKNINIEKYPLKKYLILTNRKRKNMK